MRAVALEPAAAAAPAVRGGERPQAAERDHEPQHGEAALEAASLGGDTDTIAAMAGAILGASAPDLLPVELVDQVLERSGLDLGPLCEALLAIRSAPSRLGRQV